MDFYLRGEFRTLRGSSHVCCIDCSGGDLVLLFRLKSEGQHLLGLLEKVPREMMWLHIKVFNESPRVCFVSSS